MSSPIRTSPSSARFRRRSSSNPMAADIKTPQTALSGRGQTLHVISNFCLRLTKPALLLSAAVYGITLFTFFALRGFIEGCVWTVPSKLWWEQLAAERAKQYDLSNKHPSGLNHAFFDLPVGLPGALPENLRLHYLTNAEQIIVNHPGQGTVTHKKTKNLVIFLHGWPDTGAMWQFVIRKLPNSTMKDTTVVAVDLPGFGGSDSFPRYGANEVLTAMTEFCIGMRDEYLDNTLGGTVLNVSFDWGGVVGFRLAAQAPEIADRFIFCNTVLPQVAAKNAKERYATFTKLISVWYRKTPTSFKRFRQAFSPISPLVGQILKSGYIFVFNLPWPIAQQTVLRCNLWSLRFVNSLGFGYKTIHDVPEVQRELAQYLGPLPSNMSLGATILHSYGATVGKRALANQNATEPLKYYRHQLGSTKWEKPMWQAIKLTNLGRVNEAERKKTCSNGPTAQLLGALGAPATIIWGDKDPALDHRIMLEGIDDYLKKDSQVIHLPLGHWVPKQGEGPEIISAVVQWALAGASAGGALERVFQPFAGAKITVSK